MHTQKGKKKHEGHPNNKSFSLAYGIAYSRAPVNLRGLVSALNLLSTGVAHMISLVVSAAITDPHLVWDFAVPAILGGIVTVLFYWIFRHIDHEEYVLSTHQTSEPDGAECVCADGSERRIVDPVV